MITYEIDLDTPCILAEHWNSEGRPTRNHEKYRIAWEKAHGPIPDGLEILHLCCAPDPTCPGGRTCVHRRCRNVLHLALGTRSENLKMAKPRSAESEQRRLDATRAAMRTPEVREKGRRNAMKRWNNH